MIPRIESEYKLIYSPAADAFPGPDSEHLNAGRLYDDWIVNDHTFIRAEEGTWHCFGISAPVCPKLHEGTWQAFHITSPATTIRESLETGLWQEHEKVLPFSERPGERKELWAPFIVEKRGLYNMFYGPMEMRRATSEGLFSWMPQGALFTQDGHARDPWITTIEGQYHMVYVAGNSVFLRKSKDLVEWDTGPIEIFGMDRDGAPESPMLIELEDRFYLFWTIYDGKNGSYDDRTFVFGSDTPYDFNNRKEITVLQAHAPELVQDDDGQWYVSSVERPARGVSIAPLEWV